MSTLSGLLPVTAGKDHRRITRGSKDIWLGHAKWHHLVGGWPYKPYHCRAVRCDLLSQGLPSSSSILAVVLKPGKERRVCPPGPLLSSQSIAAPPPRVSNFTH